MNEEFLSYLWKYGLYNATTLNVGGEKVEVVDPGVKNSDSGPDFLNSKIKIGNTLWVGNTEIHVRSSDWNRHNHDSNPAFNNVILHVTALHDAEVFTANGLLLNTVELKFDSSLLANYTELITRQQWVPCEDQLKRIDPFHISDWLNRMGIERMEFKMELLHKNLQETTNNWEEVLYRLITRSFGFHVNSLPFEQLAKTTPFNIVKKHLHQQFQLEALFFGQAGFLGNDYNSDEYYKKLKNEYHFLKTKYGLKTMDIHLWKFMRLRPINFPTVRIAQLAALLHNHPSLFTFMADHEQFEVLHQHMAENLSEYWDTHYNFEKASGILKKPLGKSSAQTLLINTIVPFFFVYGSLTKKVEVRDRALQFLEKLPSEKNAEIENWVKAGIKPHNALESQALLHLRAHYCSKRRCIGCGIGARIIRITHT